MKSAAILFYGAMLCFAVSGSWLLDWHFRLGIMVGILTAASWLWMTASVRP